MKTRNILGALVILCTVVTASGDSIGSQEIGEHYNPSEQAGLGTAGHKTKRKYKKAKRIKCEKARKAKRQEKAGMWSRMQSWWGGLFAKEEVKCLIEESAQDYSDRVGGKCPYCGKSFKRAGLLKMHVQKRHQKELRKANK